jgi:hypothetical protein
MTNKNQDSKETARELARVLEQIAKDLQFYTDSSLHPVDRAEALENSLKQLTEKDGEIEFFVARLRDGLEADGEINAIIAGLK